MTTHRTSRRADDKGFSLVEVLVAILLFAIFTTIISATIISAMKTTRTSQAGVMSQSQLNDAVTRITRDIATSDPLILTTTANTWATAANGGTKATPATDELWLQTVRNGKCVRVRYWVDASDTSNKKLKSTTQTFPTSTCPDPRLPDTSVNGVDATIVEGLNSTSAIFTYYNKANTVLTAPVSRSDLPLIARVQISVAAIVKDRPNGVRLTTSVAPRSALPPNTDAGGTGGPTTPPVTPAPVCPTTLTVTDGGYNTAAVITWSSTANTTTYTLKRGSTTISTQSWSSSQSTYTYSDAAVAGTTVVVTYNLQIDGPGGTVNCAPPPAPAAGVPTLTVTVTPDTSGGYTAWGSATAPSVNLSWTSVASATSYTIFYRPLTDGTFAASGTGSWTQLASVTGTSYTHSPGFDAIYQYYVAAVVGGTTGSASNAPSALTHPATLTTTATYNSCSSHTISWGAGGATTDGYTVYGRPSGSSSWTVVANMSGTATRSYTYTSANGSWEYMVVPYNTGPRGTSTNQNYDGLPSNVAAASGAACSGGSPPANPVTSATGTENNNAYNPDGRNTATWTSVSGATSYELWIFDTGSTTTALTKLTGLTSTTYQHTSLPRGSRYYYMAIACNSYGCSPNKTNPSGYAVAYQRPTTSPLTVTSAPTLALNDVSMSFSLTADAGEGASDKFCASGNLCYYTLVKDGVAASPMYNTPSTTASYNGSETTNSADWGHTDGFGIVACNPGGCGDPTQTTANHYPGPFTINSMGLADNTEVDWRHWDETGDNSSPSPIQFNTFAVSWTASAGASNYRFQRNATANDQLSRSNDTTVTSTSSPSLTFTPGAAYGMQVTANAANGLTRPMLNTYQSPPAASGMQETTRICKTTQTNTNAGGDGTWKMGKHFKTQAITRNGVGGAGYGSFADYFTSTEVVGRLANGNGGIYSYWSQRADNAANAGNSPGSSWVASAWVAGSTFFWNNPTYTANNVSGTGGAMTAVDVNVAGGITQDNYRISGLADSGGIQRVTATVNRFGAHATDYGSFTGPGLATFEWTNGATNWCPAGQSGWGAAPGFVSRYAHPTSPAAVNPNPNGWGASG